MKRTRPVRVLRTLIFEPLEDRLALSVSPSDPNYADYLAWRDSAYQVEEIAAIGSDGVSAYTPTIQGDVSASLNQTTSLIGLDRVFAQYSYRGTGYTVAVIDTGVDYNHAALGGGWGNRVIAGYDFVNNDGDPMDDNGHGTHVAGIIGSSNATYGGIAPNINIVALKVLGAGGSGSFGDVEDALKWVINNRAQYNIVAVNLSLGAGNYTSNPYTFLEDEFQSLVSQNVFVAAASGNSFYSNNSQPGLGYPSISSNVVSVGAVWDGNYGSVSWSSGARDYSTASDRITSFTQRSSALDILAPGALVTAPYLGGGYSTLAGTSMATPVIAGAAALIHQALDSLGRSAVATQAQILALMQNTGVLLQDGDDENDNVANTGLHFRRLDLYAALSSLAPQALTLNIGASTVREDAGNNAVMATITRSGDMSQSLMVTLQSNDTSEIGVLTTVTIAAGQSSANFYLNAINDARPDGTRTVTITAAASGYSSGTDTILVTDDEVGYLFDFGTETSPLAAEYLRVSHLTSYNASRGYGWLSGSIDSRNRDNGNDLARDFVFTTGVATFAANVTNGTYDVTVIMGDTGSARDQMGVYLEGSLAGTVDSNAGSVSTRTFRVTVADGQLTLTLQDLGGSNIAVMLNAMDIVRVGDANTLALAIVPDSVGENAGVGAATGTLTRTGDLSSALVVTLLSSDTTEATVPSTITFNAGQSAVTFVIAAINDSIIDGTQVATITATASGYATGSDRLLVTDDEVGFRFDFGTDTSPAAAGYQRVSATVEYNTSRGFGWISGSRDSRDRGTGDDLARDFVFTTQTATFGVNVSNGVYDVTVMMGDVAAARDQMGVYLEGNLAGQLTSSAGNVATSTFRVAVVDGVLTIRIQDLGGTDGAAMLNALDILRVGDVSTLAVAVDLDSAREDGASGSITGTVTRTGDLTSALVVSLLSSDTSEAVTSATVTIAAGQASAAFAINAVNDMVMDGNQTVTISASATGYTTASDTLIITDDDVIHAFDFGTTTSPVASGYSAVAPSTAYSASRGSGWIAGTLDARDRMVGDAIGRDFIFATSAGATFAVDVPNGIYAVTVHMGDMSAARDQMGVYLEGVLAGTMNSAAGQVATATYYATVLDGQLTIRFLDLGGSDPTIVINGLQINSLFIATTGISATLLPTQSSEPVAEVSTNDSEPSLFVTTSRADLSFVARSFVHSTNEVADTRWNLRSANESTTRSTCVGDDSTETGFATSAFSTSGEITTVTSAGEPRAERSHADAVDEAFSGATNGEYGALIETLAFDNLVAW